MSSLPSTSNSATISASKGPLARRSSYPHPKGGRLSVSPLLRRPDSSNKSISSGSVASGSKAPSVSDTQSLHSAPHSCCTVRLDVRLFFSKQKYWEHQKMECIRLLSKLVGYSAPDLYQTVYPQMKDLCDRDNGINGNASHNRKASSSITKNELDKIRQMMLREANCVSSPPPSYEGSSRRAAVPPASAPSPSPSSSSFTAASVAVSTNKDSTAAPISSSARGKHSQLIQQQQQQQQQQHLQKYSDILSGGSVAGMNKNMSKIRGLREKPPAFPFMSDKKGRASSAGGAIPFSSTNNSSGVKSISSSSGSGYTTAISGTSNSSGRNGPPTGPYLNKFSQRAKAR